MSSPHHYDTVCLSGRFHDPREGLPKKCESFLFFEITNPGEFQKKFRSVIPLITTAEKVKEDRAAIAAHKLTGLKTLLMLVGTNVAFSSAGLKKVCWILPTRCDVFG